MHKGTAAIVVRMCSRNVRVLFHDLTAHLICRPTRSKCLPGTMLVYSVAELVGRSHLRKSSMICAINVLTAATQMVAIHAEGYIAIAVRAGRTA
jgi:hypothetical protein